jgi:hypothetical protein
MISDQVSTVQNMRGDVYVIRSRKQNSIIKVCDILIRF